MKKERFDAITDAILAIIITLMILEIKIPELGVNKLASIFYQIAVYAMSFVTIAIVWLNHHRISSQKERIDINSVWLNFGMLFVISFILSATAHLSQSFFEIAKHIFYGTITTLVVFFYAVFQHNITKSDNSKGVKLDRKMSWSAMIIYALSIPLSFVSIYVSGFIFSLIPIIYFFTNQKLTIIKTAYDFYSSNTKLGERRYYPRKCMIGIAIFIILPICVFLFKNGHSLQKGMVIPLFLLFLMNIGYGGYLLSSKSKYVENMENQFQLDAQRTVKNEVITIKTDDKSYTLTKYVWTGLIIISLVCFFIINKEYYQGLSLGFAIMFLGMLLIDTFLHQRLKLYLTALYEI
ncbi:hypothetical protein GCM10023210_14050 [Chryseobacterium ginsengisoli]|uniref:DUF1211 domain-containing protein n=1 Tax=Chryseobacterium ginsengisoli TaxID=363853 RepID=A0ABP9M431_9FLAO